jgi:hypothetical protein
VNAAAASHPQPLARRLVALNAAVLLVAAAVLALSPVTISSPVAVQEALLLVFGLAAMLIIDVVLTRRALRPLSRLTQLMDRAIRCAPGSGSRSTTTSPRWPSSPPRSTPCSPASRTSGARAPGTR